MIPEDSRKCTHKELAEIFSSFPAEVLFAYEIYLYISTTMRSLETIVAMVDENKMAKLRRAESGRIRDDEHLKPIRFTNQCQKVVDVIDLDYDEEVMIFHGRNCFRKSLSSLDIAVRDDDNRFYACTGAHGWTLPWDESIQYFELDNFIVVAQDIWDMLSDDWLVYRIERTSKMLHGMISVKNVNNVRDNLPYKLYDHERSPELFVHRILKDPVRPVQGFEEDVDLYHTREHPVYLD